MIWVDYVIEQKGDHFRVKGDWDGEVMGKQRDGSSKDNWLYKPGDVFVVNETGWLVKTDELAILFSKYEKNRLTRDK